MTPLVPIKVWSQGREAEKYQEDDSLGMVAFIPSHKDVKKNESWFFFFFFFFPGKLPASGLQLEEIDSPV